MIFVIFHGAYGSPYENWFPWLKKELEALGHKVLIPQFPCEDWEKVQKTGPKFIAKKQNSSNWLTVFAKEVLPRIKKSDKVCFIGHSLGPIFILHAVDKYNLKLDCAYFVAPFLEVKNGEWQFFVVNKTFYKTDFDFAKLKRLIPISYAYYSDNDPYLNNKFSKLFAKKMGSKEILVKNAGHFNVSSDKKFKEFPQLLEEIKKRLRTSRRQVVL